MITAQDIREKGFERARMGGYDMASVDDFLEELADDVAATQKENAVLKSKMKVLVDKIEEYRSNEEALNAAILSAQKLAVQIESEARQRAAATIAEAEEKAQETLGSISARADAEEKRLADAKAAAAKFIEAAKALCHTQLGKLDKIADEMGVEEPAPAAAPTPVEEPVPVEESAQPSIDDAVSAIEKSAARLQADDGLKLDMPDDTTSYRPKKHKLENTQPFTF
ncbi:MAG: DivIVA domain-containing protein [Oscillospiraceae bacterium]|nr:DivIVA domain-containing protein [Oscillospiraceae bacterium]